MVSRTWRTLLCIILATKLLLISIEYLFGWTSSLYKTSNMSLAAVKKLAVNLVHLNTRFQRITFLLVIFYLSHFYILACQDKILRCHEFKPDVCQDYPHWSHDFCPHYCGMCFSKFCHFFFLCLLKLLNFHKQLKQSLFVNKLVHIFQYLQYREYQILYFFPLIIYVWKGKEN